MESSKEEDDVVSIKGIASTELGHFPPNLASVSIKDEITWLSVSIASS